MRNNHGGKRNGAGAPKKSFKEKKRNQTFKLSPEAIAVLDRLAMQGVKKGPYIENLILKSVGL